MASVTAADTVLHHVQTEILTQVQGNTKLAVLAVSGTLTGFAAVPVGLAAGVTAEKAPHANLAEIDVIFNGAPDRVIDAINSSNLAAIEKNFTAVRTDLKHLIAKDPTLFGDRLHRIHAETILNQISLQVNDVDAQYDVDAVRSTDDEIFDIVDIVHGDTVLDNNANQGGVNVWTEFPINANNAGEYLSGTINRYQDSAATQGWAKFIVGANTLTAKANAAVAAGNQTLINTVISEIQAYQNFGAGFDNAQGGVFASRFDNELLNGTLLEDANAAIQRLKSSNAALVAAAGSIADAKDVSGNNVPVTGSKYNGNATTITQALSMAHSTAAGTNGSTPQTTNGTPAGGQTITPPASTPPGGGTYSSPRAPGTALRRVAQARDRGQGTTPRAAAARPRVGTIRRHQTITITASIVCGTTCNR